MSAFACSPARGSEEGVGWNWAVQVARYHEVWVITSHRDRDQIESELKRNPNANLHFVFHDIAPWKAQWRTGVMRNNLYFRAWQLAAVPLARRLQRRINFDLGHQVTYVTFRHPSFLAWLNIPFIWGPVAGGDLMPRAFWSEMAPKELAREIMRSLSVWGIWLDPLVQFTARRSSTILAATQSTRQSLPQSLRAKTRVMPAIGVNPSLVSLTPHENTSDSELRLLYVGHLLHLKGIQFGLRALASVRIQRPELEISLTIVGDGPYRKKLEGICEDLGISERVQFMGWVDYASIDEYYSSHDAFLFPSLTDSGGMVVLEAMRVGLPVICLDIGGPAISVTAASGIRVSAESPTVVVSGLAQAMVDITVEPSKRRLFAEGARFRVEQACSWNEKGRVISELYKSTRGKGKGW